MTVYDQPDHDVAHVLCGRCEEPIINEPDDGIQCGCDERPGDGWDFPTREQFDRYHADQ